MTYYQPGGSIIRTLPSDEKIESFFKEFVRQHLEVLDSTVVNNLPQWMTSLGANHALIRKGEFIQKIPKPPNGPTIVVGAGPSIWRRSHLRLLKKAAQNRAEFHGLILATDKMLVPLLKIGIVPDYVMTCDGSPDAFKFYDPEQITHPFQTTGLFATTTHPSIIAQWVAYGNPLYWFNIIIDSPKDLMGVTRAIHYLTGGDQKAMTLDSLGNVGSGCVVFAFNQGRGTHKKKPIGLIGMDFSLEGDDPRKTEWWENFIRLKKDHIMENPDEYFKVVKNKTYGTSHVIPFEFDLYRVTLLNVIRGLQPRPHVWNCSEQGMLFSNELKGLEFVKFLKKYWK